MGKGADLSSLPDITLIWGMENPDEGSRWWPTSKTQKNQPFSIWRVRDWKPKGPKSQKEGTKTQTHNSHISQILKLQETAQKPSKTPL